MSKFGIVVMICFAALAVSVVTATAAVAAEFLFNGEKIAAGVKLAVRTTDVAGTSLLMEDMEGSGGAVDILCDGWFNGEITGPENGDVTEVLNMTETSREVKCSFDTKGSCEGTETTMEAVNLPWLTVPLLVTIEGTPRMLVDFTSGGAGIPGYAIKCKTILGTLTDTCSNETSAEARNVASGIENEFSESNETITPTVECSLGGGRGLESGSVITADSTGGVLAVSE